MPPSRHQDVSEWNMGVSLENPVLWRKNVDADPPWPQNSLYLGEYSSQVLDMLKNLPAYHNIEEPIIARQPVRACRNYRKLFRVDTASVLFRVRNPRWIGVKPIHIRVTKRGNRLGGVSNAAAEVQNPRVWIAAHSVIFDDRNDAFGKGLVRFVVGHRNC